MGKLNSLGKTTKYLDHYNPNILEKISREERRFTFRHEMRGYDIWNCYEVSYLTPSGKPEFLQLKIINPSDSKFIWESKSLKLYLFSLNNTIFNNTIELKETIQFDLQKLVDDDRIKVFDYVNYKEKNHDYGQNIDRNSIVTDIYSPEKKLLNPISQHNTIFRGYSDLLRSNCEITNQPDWARCYISYESDNYIKETDLLKYIVSFRNHQQFHEPTCETIYQDLYDVLDPKKLIVICQYTRRGGIDINPVRFSLYNILQSEIGNYYLPKLTQQ